MEQKEFSSNKEFLKSFKEKLKDKGLILTNPELDIVYKAFLETIVFDYVFKFKKIAFKNFGTFEGLLFRIKPNGLVKRDFMIYPKFKFSPSIQLKNEFKRRYQTLQEKKE